MAALLSLDSITRRKLITVKLLYQHALSQAATGYNQSARIIAVIGLDLTIETILRITADSLEPNKSNEKTYQALVQQVDGLLGQLGVTIPDKSRIYRLHDLRNDVQHKSKYPDVDAVNECRLYCRDFLSTFCRMVWDIDLFSLSFIELIKDEKAKHFLQTAGSELIEEHYNESVNYSAAALIWALNSIEACLLGDIPNLATWDALISAISESYVLPSSSDSLEVLSRMRHMVMVTALHLDFSSYMRLRQLAVYVRFSADGTPRFNPAFETRSRDDADFALEYATNAIVDMETKVGNLKQPYGILHPSAFPLS